MSSYKTFKIYCATESIDKFVDSTTPPTVCPTDSGHTVRLNSVSVVDENPFGRIIEVLETTEPSTPPENKNIIYFDSADSLLATKDDTGFVRKYYGSKTNVIYVSPLGESDFLTIKDAVVAANAKLPSIQSTIIVQPGTYSENNPITIGAGISLVSAGGPQNTVVIAQNPSSRLFIVSASTSIRGFTLSGVTGNAAIYHDGSAGQASVNEAVILNSDVGIQTVNGPSFCFANKVLTASTLTPGNTTVNTSFLAQNGGAMLLTNPACNGVSARRIGLGYKSVGKNSGTSVPSKMITISGIMAYCDTGASCDNGGANETYMMKIDNSNTAFLIGNLGTDSSLLVNNTTITNSSTYDLNVQATNATVRAMASQMDTATKVNNPNNVPLRIFTSDTSGNQNVYADLNVYGNINISGNLGVTGNVSGIYGGISVNVDGTTATNGTYVTLARVIFPGTTTFGVPTSIKFVSKQDVTTAVNHNVRILDNTNGNAVVCTSDTLTNTTEAINSITTIGNLSTDSSNWYIQGKVDNTLGIGNMYLYTLQINP